MAKKFFYNRVHNTKRTIINVSIIVFCVIGIIICFVITSNFQGENRNEPKGELSLNNETTIEVNESYSNDIFFSKIENVSLDDIEVIYPKGFDVSKVGEYELTIKVGDEERKTTLKIVDTIMPELTVKEYTIKENGNYKANDFVTSCSDNSNKNCHIAFVKDAVDQDGNKIDYTQYKKEGTYSIKISAKDDAGNENIKETKLIIGKVSTEQPETECKYGNSEYDKDVYVLAVDKTSNGCAVSLDLYKDDNMTAEVDKIIDTESVRIKKDVNALKIDGMPALNIRRTAVLNSTGTGIVGYQIRITVSIKKGEDVKTIVDYKMDSNGKRVFISNDYNLKS